MNFALVVTNLAGGGAERAMLNLAVLLDSRGHGVDMILLEPLVEHTLPQGIRLHVACPGGVGHGWLGKRLAAWRLKRLWTRLDAVRPIDLVISTLPFCDEVVRLAGLPRTRYRIANTLSAEIDHLAERNPTKAARRLARYRAIYTNQALVAVSKGVADDLRQRIVLADTADIATIYNPFDFDRIRRLARTTEPDQPTRPYVIHVGRFVPQKRHDLLLMAWRQASLDLALVLLTEPNDALDRLIESNGLKGRVVVAGFRPNPFPWIAGAELLVLCSDHEGLPNVLVEALACGTRVVSTDCPSGPREVLRGSLARWLVPLNDPHTLANRMVEALAGPRPCIAHELDDFAADAVVARYEALAGGHA